VFPPAGPPVSSPGTPLEIINDANMDLRGAETISLTEGKAHPDVADGGVPTRTPIPYSVLKGFRGGWVSDVIRSAGIVPGIKEKEERMTPAERRKRKLGSSRPHGPPRNVLFGSLEVSVPPKLEHVALVPHHRRAYVIPVKDGGPPPAARSHGHTARDIEQRAAAPQMLPLPSPFRGGDDRSCAHRILHPVARPGDGLMGSLRCHTGGLATQPCCWQVRGSRMLNLLMDDPFGPQGRAAVRSSEATSSIRASSVRRVARILLSLEEASSHIERLAEEPGLEVAQGLRRTLVLPLPADAELRPVPNRLRMLIDASP